MSKSDTPLEHIDLSRAYSPPHKPAWAKGKAINGFDTETADGDIFALSVAWHGYSGAVYADKTLLTPEEIFEKVTNRRARGGINVWYNLDFDANVILKHLLTPEELATLTVSGSVQAGRWEIAYIPSKFLRVKDDNKHVYTHYDASQFFYGGLEEAAREWLGGEKLSEGIDVTRFGKDGDRVNAYIEDNWHPIEKYARKDAELVRDLWIEATSEGEHITIPMGKPFSTGYLGESYLNAVMREKPGLGPRAMTKLAWQAYAGGRFEVLKRGQVGKVAGPDINSAYPWVLSQLPDPKTLTWTRYSEPSISELREADYGFVQATVTTDKTRTIQPFAVKLDGKLTFPALYRYPITCLKEIFLNAYDYGYLQDFEITNSWLGYDEGAGKYPYGFIPSKYDERQEAKAQGLTKKAQLLKIILNSIYGKTCQTTPKRRKVTETVTLNEYESFIPSLSLPPSIREGYNNGFIEVIEAGGWFNPFLAAYITGMTRLELHKRILEHGLEDNVIMLATDSLMVEREPFEASGFAKALEGSKLGQWDYDYKGEAFIVGAGVYEVVTRDGLKTQTRGFKEADLWCGLEATAYKSNGTIEIESTRPRTIAEQIWHGQPLSEVGKFGDFSRELNAGFDTKRVWDQPAESFKNLLGESHTSRPITISGTPA